MTRVCCARRACEETHVHRRRAEGRDPAEGQRGATPQTGRGAHAQAHLPPAWRAGVAGLELLVHVAGVVHELAAREELAVLEHLLGL